MAKRTSQKNSIWTKFALVLLILGAGYFVWHQYQLYVRNGFHLPIIDNRPEAFNTFGIDISHYQGAIDWEDMLVKNELDSIISFVYFKVSEGVSHEDGQWSENRNMLNKFGKKSGAYHFFLPNKDALQQANHFLEQYDYQQGDLPPVLDVELEAKSDRILIENIKIWLKQVERKTGIKPIIYTSLHFYTTKFEDEFKSHSFWVASYSRMPELENDPRIVMWQYSQKGRLPGIAEKVDLNVARRFY